MELKTNFKLKTLSKIIEKQTLKYEAKIYR